MTVESITWLRLLRLVIGLKDSRQFFNQWEVKPKPKPIAPWTRDFSRASSELQVIARNSDWFLALFLPVVIGQSDYFGFGFSTVIWNRSNCEVHEQSWPSKAYHTLAFCEKKLFSLILRCALTSIISPEKWPVFEK